MRAGRSSSQPPRARGRPSSRSSASPLTAAIAAYTAGSAYANHLDDTGSIRPGSLADLVVLDRDPYTGPPEEIGHTRVLQTYVGGRRVHEAERSCGGPTRPADGTCPSTPRQRQRGTRQVALRLCDGGLISSLLRWAGPYSVRCRGPCPFSAKLVAADTADLGGLDWLRQPSRPGMPRLPRTPRRRRRVIPPRHEVGLLVGHPAFGGQVGHGHADIGVAHRAVCWSQPCTSGLVPVRSLSCWTVCGRGGGPGGPSGAVVRRGRRRRCRTW